MRSKATLDFIDNRFVGFAITFCGWMLMSFLINRKMTKTHMFEVVVEALIFSIVIALTDGKIRRVKSGE